MATVLEECNTEEHRYGVHFFFLWAKGFNAKDIHRCFMFTAGSVCRIKWFTYWVKTFSHGHLKIADDARLGVKVAETTVKRLLYCGFRRTGKAMGQVYQCWWRICQETNAFSKFEYHTFYILYPFVTYLLTLYEFQFLKNML
jgi:hypothetical protein